LLPTNQPLTNFRKIGHLFYFSDSLKRNVPADLHDFSDVSYYLQTQRRNE
jgi:hypothetical protein